MFKRNKLSLKLSRENINLFLFTGGKAISLFGSAIYTFTLGLFILKTTGSALSFATNIILYTLPLVFATPLAGVITDRIDRKKVVVYSDLFSFLFLLLVYLLATRYNLNLLLVYISTFILTISASFNNISIEAAKPEMVCEEKLISINSIANIVDSASNIMGPVIGGLVYALIDIKLFILINGISFLLAALLEYFIDFHFNKSEKNLNDNDEELLVDGEIENNIWQDIKTGFLYIYSRTKLRALIYIAIALNFFISFSFTVPEPYLLNTTWKINPTFFGIIEGGFPVGILIGAVIIKPIMKKVRYRRLLKWVSIGMIIETILFSLPLLIWTSKPTELFILIYYGVLMVTVGIVISWVDIPLMVILQQLVPGQILGRVLSMLISIVKIIVPLTVLLSGALLNILSPIFLFLGGGAFMMIFSLIFFASASGKSIKTIQESLSN